MDQGTRKPFALFLALGFVTAAVAIFFAVLMTEPGQSLNLPREWVVGYYANRWLLIGLNLALLAGLWSFHFRYAIWRRSWMVLASIGVALCIIAANFLLPTFFPSSQDGANFVSVQDTDLFLDDDSVIYAVEVKGEVKGFPRKHLEIPHIAGATIGGEDIVMTFCALSNLPVVYNQSVDDETMNLEILIQVHNNLIMVDSKSGDLIQQITGEKEFSGKKLQTYANDMMTWVVFKKLHPDATVFAYAFNRPMDALLLALFEGPMEKQFSEDYGPIFPTLDLKDSRLPNKEQVWGLDVGDEQTAFSRDFVKANPIHQFQLGGRDLVIAYDQEHDVVTVFDRTIDDTTIDVVEIDHDGNTPEGKLRKVPAHNGVFWMVWSHWFPETKLDS